MGLSNLNTYKMISIFCMILIYGLGIAVDIFENFAVPIVLLLFFLIQSLSIIGWKKTAKIHQHKEAIKKGILSYTQDTGVRTYGMNDLKFVSWVSKKSVDYEEIKQEIRKIKDRWISFITSFLGAFILYIILTVVFLILKGDLKLR